MAQFLRVRPGCAAALLLTITLGVYGVVATFGSIAHHDLACHQKSRTHCTTCVFNASPPGADANATVDTVALPEAGRAWAASASTDGRAVVGRPYDRSPPA